MKNKKGGDKIISVYWFAVLFIVAAGIVYMVFSFYGKPYDVREVEANILLEKVADCLTENNYLRTDVFEQSFGANFLNECRLNFETENFQNWREAGQYYVEFEILEFNSKQEIFSFNQGNFELKEFCDLNSVNFPVCVERSFYLVDSEENQSSYQINILSIVRKTEKNVQ